MCTRVGRNNVHEYHCICACTHTCVRAYASIVSLNCHGMASQITFYQCKQHWPTRVCPSNQTEPSDSIQISKLGPSNAIMRSKLDPSRSLQISRLGPSNSLTTSALAHHRPISSIKVSWLGLHISINENKLDP